VIGRLTQSVTKVFGLCSGSVQIKMAAAHTRSLKQKRHKVKLTLSLGLLALSLVFEG
jgi:hypothetical protein